MSKTNKTRLLNSEKTIMLSNLSRGLTYATALLYGVLGAVLFLMPEQLAPSFAWNVTAFMTMTIGGWCLGNAWMAFICAVRWDWKRIYPSMLYLWLFGISQVLVVASFRDKLKLEHPLAVLYLLTLAVNIICTLVTSLDRVRVRSSHAFSGQSLTLAQRLPTFGFVLFVGFLGFYGVTAPLGAPGTNGGIFPEIMSAFTLRSFGAFYLCLALAVIPLFREKNPQTLLHHAFAAYGLIFFITLAAFVYIHLFDFIARPGGLAYFGAYLIVGLPLLVVFRKYGTGNRYS
jgi:hypothetical protein